MKTTIKLKEIKPEHDLNRHYMNVRRRKLYFVTFEHTNEEKNHANK